MKTLVTEFFGTVVGRHPFISINENGDRYNEAEMFDVDINAYRPISYAPHLEDDKGKKILLSQKARIQFTGNAYELGNNYQAYDDVEKTLNSLTVGTEIAFRVESGEKVNSVNEKVGYKITAIKIIGNKRLNMEEYLFSFHKEQGYI